MRCPVDRLQPELSEIRLPACQIPGRRPGAGHGDVGELGGRPGIESRMGGDGGSQQSWPRRCRGHVPAGFIPGSERCDGRIDGHQGLVHSPARWRSPPWEEMAMEPTMADVSLIVSPDTSFKVAHRYDLLRLREAAWWNSSSIDPAWVGKNEIVDELVDAAAEGGSGTRAAGPDLRGHLRHAATTL